MILLYCFYININFSDSFTFWKGKWSKIVFCLLLLEIGLKQLSKQFLQPVDYVVYFQQANPSIYQNIFGNNENYASLYLSCPSAFSLFQNILSLFSLLEHFIFTEHSSASERMKKCSTSMLFCLLFKSAKWPRRTLFPDVCVCPFENSRASKTMPVT